MGKIIQYNFMIGELLLLLTGHSSRLLNNIILLNTVDVRDIISWAGLSSLGLQDYSGNCRGHL